MAVVDYLSAFFNAISPHRGINHTLSAVTCDARECWQYYALVLFATTGFMFVAAAGSDHDLSGDRNARLPYIWPAA
jgi:hypothetical protein